MAIGMLAVGRMMNGTVKACTNMMMVYATMASISMVQPVAKVNFFMKMDVRVLLKNAGTRK